MSGALAPALGVGTPIGEATRGAGAPEQPLPVFFSIWGVIFFCYFIFALIYALRREPWMDAVARPLALAGLFNVIWMINAQLIASQPLDFVLLFPIAFCAWWAALRFDHVRGMGGSAAKFFADAATGLLAGWISVAIAISIPLTVRSFTQVGATDLPWQMLWLSLCAGMLAAWLFAGHVSRSLFFFVSLGWGLLGILLNNWLVTDMGWLAIVTGIILFLSLWLRLTRGANGARGAA